MTGIGGNGYLGYAKNGYSKRYIGITTRAKERILLAVDSLIAQGAITNHLSILDYGCGDGRYFEAAELVANYVKDKGITVDYYGYDPTDALLDYAEKNLQFGNLTQRRYQKAVADPRCVMDVAQDEAAPAAPDAMHAPYAGPTYSYAGGNLRFHLLGGRYVDAHDNPQALKEMLPDADLTLCMFGVLSHVPHQKGRREVLNILSEKTKGALLLSVPTQVSHAEKLEEYNHLREEFGHNPADNDLQSKLGLATEAGDIYYQRPAEKENAPPIRIYYHLYSKDELQADLNAAGFDSQIGASTVDNEANLRSAKHIDKDREKAEAADAADAETARPLHEQPNFDRSCTYMWAEAVGSAAKANGLTRSDLAPLDAVHAHLNTISLGHGSIR